MSLSPSVLEALDSINNLQSEIQQVAVRMMAAADGALYTIDIVAIAALNRSYALTAAFGLLIERRNLVSAAGILRMQLDNALRFSALWHVPNADEAARQILRGVRVKNLKDRSGQRLTDAHLQELAKEDQELAKEDKDWVPEVYEKASGYIHLSTAHVASAIAPGEVDPDQFHFKVSAEDERVPDQTWLEAMAAFQASTDLFLQLIERWTEQKAKAQGLADSAERIGTAPAANHESTA
jgi:hypothetical protein